MRELIEGIRNLLELGRRIEDKLDRIGVELHTQTQLSLMAAQIPDSAFLPYEELPQEEDGTCGRCSSAKVNADLEHEDERQCRDCQHRWRAVPGE